MREISKRAQTPHPQLAQRKTLILPHTSVVSPRQSQYSKYPRTGQVYQYVTERKDERVLHKASILHYLANLTCWQVATHQKALLDALDMPQSQAQLNSVGPHNRQHNPKPQPDTPPLTNW